METQAMGAARSRMLWSGVMCMLLPLLCSVVLMLEGQLLDRGVLNTEDLTVAAGKRGTLSEELLNVWTWDAIGGLSCALSVLAVPVGILLFEAATRPGGSATPTDRGGG